MNLLINFTILLSILCSIYADGICLKLNLEEIPLNFAEHPQDLELHFGDKGEVYNEEWEKIVLFSVDFPIF